MSDSMKPHLRRVLSSRGWRWAVSERGSDELLAGGETVDDAYANWVDWHGSREERIQWTLRTLTHRPTLMRKP